MSQKSCQMARLFDCWLSTLYS